MLQFNLDVPESDIVRLRETMARYVTFLKGDAPKAVNRVAVKIALALRASTKGTRQPPKKRPVVPNPLYTAGAKSGGKRDRMKEHISDYYTTVLKRPELDLVSFTDKSMRFKAKKAVYRIRNKKRIFMPVYDNTKRAAVTSPLRLIKKRGLADASWFWMLGRIGANKGKAPAVGVTEKGRVAFATPEGSADNYAITLENKLKHIRDAFFTSGDSAVSGVVARATTMMRKEMERAVEAAKRAAFRG